jgi:hypothetical protein
MKLRLSNMSHESLSYSNLPKELHVNCGSGAARIWRLGGKHGEREPIWGSGVETPSGVQSKAPGQGAKPPEAESSSMFLKGSFR